MSYQPDAIGSTGLEQTYEELLKDLESLEHDLFHSGLSEDSLFIDDIIVRLKVWASDINIQGGTLATVSKIGPLATKLQSRLDQLKSLTKSAGTSFTQNQAPTENGHQFLEYLNFLAMFVEPIKTVNTQTPSYKEDHASKIEGHLIMSNIREWIGKPDWIFLRTPVASPRFDHLLGAMVKDPSSPTDSWIRSLSLSELTPRDASLRTFMSKLVCLQL